MRDFEKLKVTKEDRLGIVTLANPPANTISQKVIHELEEAFDELAADDEVKAVLLCGEGRFFAAGADIKEFTAVSHGQQFSDMSREGQRVFRKIEMMTKPVIAAIHGAALGGGLELALACHIRLAASDAKLGLPELQLGLIPGFAGTQRLPKLIGKPEAVEMMLTSEPLTGEEAKAAGLVNRTVAPDRFLEEAKAFTGKITSKSSVSTTYILELIHSSDMDPLERGQEKEAVRFGDASESRDASEGIKAFLEKRKPVFEDR